MPILDVSDVDRFFSIPTSAGARQVVEFQGYYYLFQKACLTIVEATSIYRQNLNQGSSSIILNRDQSEVWVRAKQQDVIGKLAKTVALPERKPSMGERPVIAYVDDSVVDGNRMKQIIDRCSLAYIHIPNSLTAIPVIIEQKPSLIFLDVIMSVTNGYELCSQIRRVSQFKETPIIMVTGTDSIVDRARAKLAGSTEFLAKPFDGSVITEILQRHGLIQPSSSKAH